MIIWIFFGHLMTPDSTKRPQTSSAQNRESHALARTAVLQRPGDRCPRINQQPSSPACPPAPGNPLQRYVYAGGRRGIGYSAPAPSWSQSASDSGVNLIQRRRPL